MTHAPPQAESEEYLGEIEKVGAAYEDVQAQNARLLAALGQREEDQARLLAESAAAAQVGRGLGAGLQSGVGGSRNPGCMQSQAL